LSAILHRLVADETAALARELERSYAEDMERHGGFASDVARRKATADVAQLLEDETAAAYAVARRLYRSLGYNEIGVVMTKDVQ